MTAMTPDGGAFVLAGYQVQSLVGFGATGEVWRAREIATGDTVALKRLRPGADPAAVDVLRREASLLRTLDTPYVVRLRAVVGDGDAVVLVLDHAGGGSLASLLTRRGSLDPGEVVTVAGPLAAALAVAHEQGVVHGDVSPANVLFTAEGMPLLSDLGVARTAADRWAHVDGTAEYVDPVVAAGGEPDEAADVWALGAVCHHMLCGSPPHEGPSAQAVLSSAVEGGRAPLGLLAPSAPRALVAAVEAALQRDPAARPDAAQLASLIRRAYGTAPVRLAGPATSAVLAEPRPTSAVRSWSAAEADVPRGRWAARLARWRGGSARHHLRAGHPGGSPSRLRGPALLLLLVVLAATAGWWSGRGTGIEPAGTASTASPVGRAGAPSPAAGPTAPASLEALPAEQQQEVFATVLTQLTAARAAAFARADPSLLEAAYASGSPAGREDRRRVEALREQGGSARGLTHHVLAVEVLALEVAAGGRGSARLRVVDSLPEYEIRTAAGGLTTAAARGPRAHLVELTHGAQGWRLLELTAL